MRRRRALGAMLSLGIALPLRLRAQTAARTYRVGLFLGGTQQAVERQRKLIVERLAANGFVEGRNLAVDIRIGAFNRFFDAEVARALVAAKPDAILVDTTPLAQRMREATRSIPFVFIGVADPIAAGLVKDFSRPGGNATGVHFSQLEIGAKRLELLRELLPHATRVMIARDIAGPDYDTLPHLQKVASRLAFTVIEAPVSWGAGFIPVTWASAYDKPDALLSGQPWVFYGMERVADQMIRFATEQRVPSVFWESELAERGATLTYGVNVANEFARGADQLARILKGAKAGELPVEQATSYELVVNRKAAAALKVAIPSSLIARADRVID